MDFGSSSENVARLTKLSEMGDANSTLTLAEIARASGVRPEEYEVLYIMSVEQGSEVAALALANYYEAQSSGRAVEWYRRACSMGNAIACTHLSMAYMEGGLGLPVDHMEAERLALRARELSKNRE